MTRRWRKWQDRSRMVVGHVTTRPLNYFFNLLPGWEYGLLKPQLTRLAVPHQPLSGRRAVQLSDLHLDRYLYRHKRTARIVRDLRPDWIFVTGDLLNVPSGLPHLFRFLRELRRIAPVYITLGNHDHYSGVPVEHFAELAERYKIVLLVNQTTMVSTDAGELAIVGLDDPSLHRAELQCIPPACTDRFTLVLAHAPNIADQLEAHHHVDLVLCGHSHGGQWRPPLFRPFWLPPGCEGRSDGLYDMGRYRLYVNRGLGWSVVPMRWNCAPEILLLEWVDASQSRAEAA